MLAMKFLRLMCIRTDILLLQPTAHYFLEIWTAVSYLNYHGEEVEMKNTTSQTQTFAWFSMLVNLVLLSMESMKLSEHAELKTFNPI